jgi:hypothetical protein
MSGQVLNFAFPVLLTSQLTIAAGRMYNVWCRHLFHWYRDCNQLGMRFVWPGDLLAYACGHQQCHMRGVRGWNLWDRIGLPSTRKLHKVSAWHRHAFCSPHVWHRHAFCSPHVVAELHTVCGGQVPKFLWRSSMHRMSSQHLSQQDRCHECDQLHELSSAEYNHGDSFHRASTMPLQAWLLGICTGTAVFAV